MRRDNEGIRIRNYLLTRDDGCTCGECGHKFLLVHACILAQKNGDIKGAYLYDIYRVEEGSVSLNGR